MILSKSLINSFTVELSFKRWIKPDVGTWLLTYRSLMMFSKVSVNHVWCLWWSSQVMPGWENTAILEVSLLFNSKCSYFTAVLTEVYQNWMTCFRLYSKLSWQNLARTARLDWIIFESHCPGWRWIASLLDHWWVYQHGLCVSGNVHPWWVRGLPYVILLCCIRMRWGLNFSILGTLLEVPRSLSTFSSEGYMFLCQEDSSESPLSSLVKIPHEANSHSHTRMF